MRYKQHSARREATHRIRFAHMAVFLAGAVLFIGGPIAWFATPWPTEAARYAWREWREPVLAIALDRSDARLAMEIGNAYYGAPPLGSRVPRYDPALAKRAFSKALAIKPGILWGHYSLARIAFAEGSFETALADINAELVANPENLRSLYIRGLIYGYRDRPGDLAHAESDFTRFTSWAPLEWAGHNDLAWILTKEGQYAEVEDVIKRAFAQVPEGRENPWLWNALGVARLNASDAEGAAEAFGEALARARELTPADWRRAYSGNNPARDAAGLEAFVSGILENLAHAGGEEGP